MTQSLEIVDTRGLEDEDVCVPDMKPGQLFEVLDRHPRGPQPGIFMRIEEGRDGGYNNAIRLSTGETLQLFGSYLPVSGRLEIL